MEEPLQKFVGILCKFCNFGPKASFQKKVAKHIECIKAVVVRTGIGQQSTLAPANTLFRSDICELLLMLLLPVVAVAFAFARPLLLKKAIIFTRRGPLCWAPFPSSPACRLLLKVTTLVR